MVSSRSFAPDRIVERAGIGRTNATAIRILFSAGLRGSQRGACVTRALGMEECRNDTT